MSPLLSVVIPVYNERATLETLVSRVEAVPIDNEIILVDDGSTDGTRDILVQHDGRPGLPGAAAAREPWQGRRACGRVGPRDVVIVKDADLEYNPSEYPIHIGPIL